MGFRKCGSWTSISSRASCELSEFSSSTNVLYAFVSGNDVLYIGKTVQPLKKRMYGYANPVATQSTNLKGNRLILELLTAGSHIDVYALPDNGLLYYGGFHVNLAAGLEDSLVAGLKPAWNKTGR